MKIKARVPILITVAIALLAACAPARPHLEEGVVITIPPSGLPAMQLNNQRSEVISCNVPGGQPALLTRKTYFGPTDMDKPTLFEVAVENKGSSCDDVQNILVSQKDLKKLEVKNNNDDEAQSFIQKLCEAAILDHESYYAKYCRNGKEGK